MALLATRLARGAAAVHDGLPLTSAAAAHGRLHGDRAQLRGLRLARPRRAPGGGVLDAQPREPPWVRAVREREGGREDATALPARRRLHREAATPGRQETEGSPDRESRWAPQTPRPTRPRQPGAGIHLG